MRTVAIAIAALTIAGCNEQPQKPAAPPASPPPVGRFVIVHSPQVERDTVLLDTVTGKTWYQVVFDELQDDPVGWSPMPHSDRDDEMTALQDRHPAKKVKASGTVHPSDLGIAAPDASSGAVNSN